MGKAIAAFGAEAESHFIDDGEDEGVCYLLWGEPGRGLSGGGGCLSGLLGGVWRRLGKEVVRARLQSM